MYQLGVPKTFIIDDFLPIRTGGRIGSFETIFAGIGSDNSIWVPLLEKAFAKMYGNYAHIEGGSSSLAI